MDNFAYTYILLKLLCEGFRSPVTLFFVSDVFTSSLKVHNFYDEVKKIKMNEDEVKKISYYVKHESMLPNKKEFTKIQDTVVN